MSARGKKWPPLMALVVLLGVVCLTGCGSGDVIDDQKTEIAVRFDVQEATGTKVRSVTCPDEVPVSVGTRFTCHVVARSGDDAVAELEVTSDNGDLRVLSLKAAD
ncbi:MAG: DUF4333 domain-containing protein [Solirubrobacterales bacterium]|nr:DUF4333 domain-containing protein [Solirubrobacterales bacterium]MCB0860136.1 DUF4333 domain-containing protein [Solirubrobacterales bacterium]HRV59291.1 DUF4333 domain-containing protein [Solirubrobacterales bacterium]